MNSQNKNYRLIERLNNLGILNGPDICSCGNKQFRLQKLSLDKTNNACFRCKIKECKKRYSVTANSFFKDFPKSKIEDIYEIIKCNLYLHFNKAKTKQYLFNEKN